MAAAGSSLGVSAAHVSRTFYAETTQLDPKMTVDMLGALLTVVTQMVNAGPSRTLTPSHPINYASLVRIRLFNNNGITTIHLGYLCVELQHLANQHFLATS